MIDQKRFNIQIVLIKRTKLNEVNNNILLINFMRRV